MPDYIYEEYGKFRVRPAYNGAKCSLGAYETREEAEAVRDAWLAEQERGEKRNREQVAAPRYELIQMPEPSEEEGGEGVLRLPAEPTLLISDPHVPYHNDELLKKAIYVTRHRHPRVRQIAILGDLFDFASISQYPKTSRQSSLNDTLRVAGDFLRSLLFYFDRAYLCNGNHDERFAKALNSPFDLQFLIDGALGGNRPDCEIHITNLDKMEWGDTWLLGHPSNHSSSGGKVASEIADIEQKSVVLGHNHRIGMQVSKSGRYLGWDIGHTTKPDYHFYVQRRLNKYPKWCAGFAVLEDGFLTHYSELGTNWAILLENA